MKEFWDSQSQVPKSNESLEKSLDKVCESLSDKYKDNGEIHKDVEFKMINIGQYMTFIITVSVLILGLFLTRLEFLTSRVITEFNHFFSNGSMTPYWDLVSNFTSLSFYKVIARSMMQVVSPGVFFMMDKSCALLESLMEFVYGLDPVVLYSMGGLCMIIAFGIKE